MNDIIDYSKAERYYIVTGYTDMRKSIDGLASMIQYQLNRDPFSSSVFFFCGKDNAKMKVLVWQEDGFLLLYKRLENGRFRWPRSEQEAKEITSQQLRWLLEGLSVEQKKVIGKSEARIAG